MKINYKQLIGLPVTTELGKYVGRVTGFELNSETHQIFKYEVRTGELLVKIFGEQLLIAPEQVVKITSSEMIVEDTTQRETACDKLDVKQRSILSDTSPVSMSK